MGKNFLNLKKYWWIGVIFLLLPAIINLCYYIPALDKAFEEPKGWTTFWGMYVGTIISSLIAFYVLHEQLKQNHKENEDNRTANNIENQKNRNLELRLFEYTNNYNKLETIKRDLIDFQISFNLLSLSSILENIINGKYLQTDIDTLTYLIRDIDEKQFKLDISMNKIPPSEELSTFNKKFNIIYTEYGILLADIIFFIGLLQHLPNKKELISDYVENHINNSCNNDDKLIQHLREQGIPITTTISNIIKNMDDYSNIETYKKKILEERYIPSSDIISDLKEELKIIILNLVNKEENRIEKLLKNNNENRYK